MKYPVLIASALIVVACGKTPSTENTEAEAPTETAPAAPASTLTPEQSAEGWKLLFDGQSMDGWRTFKNLENDSWEVVDGTLHCKPFEEAKKRADLMTVDQYGNFELSFEWKISSQGNSGVIYRATEEYDQPYFSGPEYQVLDDGGYPGEVKEKNFSGSNYDMNAPENKTLHPVGEWNTAKIVANGNHIEHWLNGNKVVEYEIGSDDWNKRKAESKWNDVVGYAQSPTGHIDLQDHQHEVWFRNIMIREL